MTNTDSKLSVETLVQARNAAVMGYRKAAADGDKESMAACKAYIARMRDAIAAKTEGK